MLIQLGGLGIMVLSTFATVLLGGRLALRSEQALEEVLDLSSPRLAYELVRFIVISTLAIEALGAVLLLLRFYQHGLPLARRCGRGVPRDHGVLPRGLLAVDRLAGPVPDATRPCWACTWC
jgi:trk system potassium uptake protein TrkH